MGPEAELVPRVETSFEEITSDSTDSSHWPQSVHYSLSESPAQGIFYLTASDLNFNGQWTRGLSLKNSPQRGNNPSLLIL